MTTTQYELSPEQRDRLAAARKAYAHKPKPQEILTAEELADASRFYFSLQNCVFSLRKGRENLELTTAEVAARIGVLPSIIDDLEAGMTNPPWKLLGDYAHAVGLTLTIAAAPAA